jgi:hypothetical protein
VKVSLQLIMISGLFTLAVAIETTAIGDSTTAVMLTPYEGEHRLKRCLSTSKFKPPHSLRHTCPKAGGKLTRTYVLTLINSGVNAKRRPTETYTCNV